MNGLIQKYKDMPIAVKASFWFVLCSLFQKGISFILTPFYTRLLTPEQYGYFSVYQSWLTIVATFATLNLSYSVINNCLNKAKNEEEKNSVVSNFQMLEIVSIFIVSFIFILLCKLNGSLVSLPFNMILLMCVHIFFNSAISLWTAKERFDFKYKKVVIITVVTTILTAFFNLILIRYLDDKNYALIVGTLLSTALIYFVIMLVNLIKGKSFFNMKLWKYAILFGLPLIPHYLSMVILSSSDKIMIESFCSYEEAALYSVAYSVASLVTIFSTALNSSLAPWTYKKLSDNEHGSIRGKINLILVFMFFIVLLISLFGPEIVFILGGNKYLEAMWVIPPVAVSAFFLLLYAIYSNVLFYYEKKLMTLIASILGAGINILLNYFLIPRYGYIAAAFTTLLSYVIVAFLHFLSVKFNMKKRKISIIYDNRIILIISLISFTIIPICYLLYLNSIVRYIILIVFFILGLIFSKSIIKLSKKLVRKS